MTAQSFRDRLVFDRGAGEILDQTRRYIMLRPDALMGMMRRLDPPTRAAAMEALADSIFEQGTDSARAYRAMSPDPSGDALAQIVAASAPELGWGCWRFEIGPDLVTLTVENSPFAAGYGPSDAPVCAPIRGMMRAVSTMILDAPATVTEAACAAMGAPRCRFEARRSLT